MKRRIPLILAVGIFAGFVVYGITGLGDQRTVSKDDPAARSAPGDAEPGKESKKPEETQAESFGAEGEEMGLSYSELPAAVKSGQVAEASVNTETGYVELLFKDDSAARTTVPPESAAVLSDDLRRSGAEVAVNSSPPEAERGVLDTVLQFLLIGVLGFLVLMIVLSIIRSRRAAAGGTGGGLGGAGGGMGLRKSAKVAEESIPTVRFKDVAGCEEAVFEVREFLDFLKKPQHFMRVGAKMPSGALLHGPPGTGKTLLAKALAGEAGVEFFSVSGTDFVEKFVGVGPARVRELFEQAQKAKDGAVVFIDEIDAVGRRRGSDNTNDEREGTLNQLLVELDGFDERYQVVVLAATNRPDILDPALTRPGRLSRQIQVGLPSENGRREIIAIHSRGKPIDEGVDLDELARVTAGCSGADLANMLNEAAIMAAREGRMKIAEGDLIEGQLRALAGPAKADQTRDPEELNLIAYHEAGHVICAEVSETHDKAQRVSIRARGQAGGLALYGSTDRMLHSPQHIHDKLVAALGGRAAEHVAVGQVSSGAANDLEKANEIARTAVERLGFSPRAGQMISGSAAGLHNLSDSTRAVHDQEVERIVAEAYGRAIEILEEHRKELDSLAAALIKGQELDRLEIEAAIKGLTPRPRPAVKKMGPMAKPALGRSEQLEETKAPPRKGRRWSHLGEKLQKGLRRRKGVGSPNLR